MEVCVLASGSAGNCICVEGGGVTLLVDAGLSCREMVKRMGAAGVEPDKIEAVLFTHDHSDHSCGIEVFNRRYPVRMLANQGTSEVIEQRSSARFEPNWEIFETATEFTVGGLTIEAFSISHDAADPVGFVFDDGESRLCIVTDLGQGSDLVRAKLSSCDVVIVESNHDPELLQNSARSWGLKNRIAGRSGHLSNADAAKLVAGAHSERLHTVLLAHLSEECNIPRLAHRTMVEALKFVGRSDIRVEVLSQHKISERYKI